MKNDELLIAYKVVNEMMTENKRSSYHNAYITVINCLANKICSNLLNNE